MNNFTNNICFLWDLDGTLIDSYKVYNSWDVGEIKTQVHFLKPIIFDEYKDMNTQQIAELVKGKIANKINSRTKNCRREHHAPGDKKFIEMCYSLFYFLRRACSRCAASAAFCASSKRAMNLDFFFGFLAFSAIFALILSSFMKKRNAYVCAMVMRSERK